jgi:hypothetical protein
VSKESNSRRLGRINFDRILHALGANDLPKSVQVQGRWYSHSKTFKHDFFAATGLYEDGRHRVILKIGRTADVLGLPASWLGWLITRHEAALYESLHDLPGVPRFIGLWEGRSGGRPTIGLVHEFVTGHDLLPRERVDDLFFHRLSELLAAIHRRGVAYVDLNKSENILVGDDGKPYLIDFQISYRSIVGSGRLLRRLQREDWYHFYKHKRRSRPDLCDEEELAKGRKKSGWISLHRSIVRPLQALRRGILRRVDEEYAARRPS